MWVTGEAALELGGGGRVTLGAGEGAGPPLMQMKGGALCAQATGQKDT